MFVARTHSGETTFSSSANTSFLTAISSKTASSTRSQPAKTSHSVPPVTSEPRKRALPSAMPAAAHELAELVRDPRDGLVDLLLGEVAQHDRNLEAAQEQQRELSRHQPGADDADLLHTAWLGVGHADTALRAALDEVEGVDGRLRLRAGKELGERVLLRAVALLERPRRRALDEVERAVRRGRRAVHLAVEARARLAADLGDVGEVGCRPPLARALLDLLEQEARATRPGTRPARRSASANPASNARRASSMRFWRSGFSTTNVTACSAPTSCGTSCVPPQPGMSPRKTSGQAKWRTEDAIVR